jgi:thiamine biosynthesis lipoprotein
MGTLVTIHVVRLGADEAVDRAFGWFHEMEARCSRFDSTSELRQLCERVGEPVEVSAILYEGLRFALSVAEETAGAFDPAAGHYRDIAIDPERRTVTLQRPLVLDLGAVVKGFAVDLAARELAPLSDFAIDAGGDLYLAGSNPSGESWSVGIRNPLAPEELLDTLRVSQQAVCTSGLYERGEHILDARTGTPARSVASSTVIAPSAMLADALATAAFVLGPVAGIELLQRMGVDGLIVMPDLQRYSTQGLRYAA